MGIRVLADLLACHALPVCFRLFACEKLDIALAGWPLP